MPLLLPLLLPLAVLGNCGDMIRRAIRRRRYCRVARRAGRGADLHEALLEFVSLVGVDLEAANLKGARFAGSDLSQANLSRADLKSARFVLSDLNQANLSRADLSLAEFPRSTLRGANLAGAILKAADLRGADLAGANLSGAVADLRTSWPEGFDPEPHGVEMLPIPTEWQLKRGDLVLGTLRRYGVDPPMLLCDFTPTAAFDEFRPLFDEVHRCARACALKEFLKASEAIKALRLQLETPDGGIIEGITLSIDGEKARLTY